MADNIPVLSTSQYVEPGNYLGEILTPQVSNLNADARVPAIIAKGSRYAQAKNIAVLRGFIFAEQLNFSSIPPYVAILQHASKGDQAAPNRLYKSDGTEFRQDEWQYIKDIDGKYSQVQIRDESFDSLATILFDYQGIDKSVRDIMPIADVRQLAAVGSQLDRAQYVEYKDFYVPMSFTPADADAENVHNIPYFGAVVADVLGGSTGLVDVAVDAEYEHNYDRDYVLACTAIGGSGSNRSASFEWQAVLKSGGANVLPPTPLHSSLAKPAFTILEGDPSMEQVLELGVKVTFDFGATHYVVGDVFTVPAKGPALVEMDARYDSGQFADISEPFVVENSGAANDMSIGVSRSANYTGNRNNNYRMMLTSVVGTSPNRVFSFVWARFGDILPITGVFTVIENNFTTHTANLANGVKVEFIIGTLAPDIGTEWQLVAKAPRIYYKAKDSREYTFKISSVTPNGVNTHIEGGFSTNTTEGRFGTFEADFSSTYAVDKEGYAILPDNVSVAFRNAASFESLDIFKFNIINSGLIDWNLEAETSDIKELTDYQEDQNGEISGIAGQKFVVLSKIPTDGDAINVQNYNTGEFLGFNWKVGTPFVFFTTNPNVPLRISYRHAGAEPDAASYYYVSANYLRPDDMYNTPLLALRLEDGRSLAAPSMKDNDLYVGNEIAWDNNTPAVYLIQPKNVSGSVFTKPDYVDAIRSARDYKRITDLCLLNFAEALDEVLNENLIACDPFERRSNLVWVGMPTGTPIGDENTEGSLVQMARRTLQTPASSAAKGSRILVAPTKATKDIRLANGTTIEVVLDGSFVALAMAATVAGIASADPAADILRRPLNGFKTVQVYNDQENKLLGSAQVNFLKGGPGAYTWGENFTVDSDGNFNAINLMTQRKYVVTVVNREMDALIGLTPASIAVGEDLVRGQLTKILTGMVAQGKIGRYLNEDLTERQMNPDVDIIVFTDKNDKSLIYYDFAWFTRNTLKKLFGLYSVNSNDFSKGVPLR